MDKDFSNMTRATTYLAYTINVLLMIILIICFCSCFSSMLTSSQAATMQNRNECKLEPFSQNYGQVESSKYKEKSEFKHISLTAATNEQNSPSNLLIGSADRFIQERMQDDKKLAIYRLNVNAYLPNLNGDVFSPNTIKMTSYALSDLEGRELNFGLTTNTHAKYKAYLYDKKTGSQIDLGELKLLQDKSYGLSYESSELAKHMEYLHLIVAIIKENDTQAIPLLYGKFY